MANQRMLYALIAACVYIAAIFTVLTIILFDLRVGKRGSSFAMKRVARNARNLYKTNRTLMRVFDQPNLKPDNTTVLTKLPTKTSSLLLYNNKKAHGNTTKRIVLHTPTHGDLRNGPRGLNMSKCAFNNCHVTVSKNTSGADAIILQGSKPTKPLPVRENPDQVFVFASMETPLYLNYVNLQDLFWSDFYNWSMTYRRDSDIPYMYGYIVSKHISKEHVFTELQMVDDISRRLKYEEYEDVVYKNPIGLANKNYSDIFRRKNVTASWLVSHCKTASKREDYVKVMNKTIDIDVFGSCNKRKCARDFEVCDKNIVTYSKFYLSFENSLCTDYITEKAFKWFERDIVIVVRGAREYGYHLPKGTYIDAEDFSSPTELALYLKQLSGNKREYIKYLKRKDMYTVLQSDDMVHIAYCNLCRKLNDIHTYRKRLLLTESWADGVCIEGKNTKM